MHLQVEDILSENEIMYDMLDLDSHNLCSDNHFNQMDYFTCSTCNANDCYIYD